jgi:hypothetical protein
VSGRSPSRSRAGTPPLTGTGPHPSAWLPERRPAPRHQELTASAPPRAIPESRGPGRGSPVLDWPGGRTRQHSVWPGHPARRGKPAGIRAGTRSRPGDISRARALSASRSHHGDARRRVDREHKPDARSLRRGRRLPDPAAPRGRRRGADRRLARELRDGHRGLARHGGRRAADRGHGSRAAPAARLGRAGRRPGDDGRRRHAAAAVPGPDDQAVPRRAHVVPAVAARPERRLSPAAHPGDRQGRARGDRRAPRTRAVRHRPGVPRPAFGARRRAPQGAAPEDHRPRAGRPRRQAVGRGRRPSADRARCRRPRRPAAAGRSRVVLPAGGPVVDPRVTGCPAVRRAAARCRAGAPGTRRWRCARRNRSLPRCRC